MLVGSLADFLVALPIGLFSSGEGNVVDRAVNSWFARYCVDNPYFIAPIVMAACLGFISHRFSQSRSALWVWLLPTGVLALNVLPSMVHPRTGPNWAFDNYFGRHCGGTECLYELFITGPFYTSVAYTIGWLIKKHGFPADTTEPAQDRNRPVNVSPPGLVL
jgi:hypothetical protein